MSPSKTIVIDYLLLYTALAQRSGFYDNAFKHFTIYDPDGDVSDNIGDVK